MTVVESQFAWRKNHPNGIIWLLCLAGLLTIHLPTSSALAASPKAAKFHPMMEVEKDFCCTVPSTHSLEVSKAFGIQDAVDELQHFQLSTQNHISEDERARDLGYIVYLRQKIAVLLQSAALDVDSTNAYIAQENSDITYTETKIVDKRSRSIKKQIMINFLTGCLTDVTGKSCALATFSLPDNLLDICDGMVQGMTSIGAARSGNSEVTEVPLPPPLLAVLGDGTSCGFKFPAGVWWFLNEEIPENERIPCQKTGKPLSGKTRRERLIDKWSQDGFLERQNRSNKSQTMKMVQAKDFSSRLLEDRSAMLVDLQSVVSQIKEDLGLVARVVRKTYDSDPVPTFKKPFDAAKVEKQSTEK